MATTFIDTITSVNGNYSAIETKEVKRKNEKVITYFVLSIDISTILKKVLSNLQIVVPSSKVQWCGVAALWKKSNVFLVARF